MTEPTNTANERITTEADGPGTVNERLSAGGPGPEGQPDTARERLSGSAAGPDAYDPADHTVAEVNSYLADVDESERERVLAAERDGQARKGVLGE